MIHGIQITDHAAVKYISEMLMTHDDHDVLQRYAVCEVAMLQAACSGHMALQRCSGLRSDWRRNVFYREIRNQIFSKYWRVRGTGQIWSLHWSVGCRLQI